MNYERIINVKADGQLLTADFLDSVIATVDIVRCNFAFDEWWDGFPAKRAHFENVSSKAVYSQDILNNTCIVPWEVLAEKGKIKVAIEGTNVDGQVERTEPINIIKQRVTILNGENSITPTPDQYAQFLRDVRQWCDEQGFSTHEELRRLLPVEIASYIEEHYYDFEGPQGDPGVNATVDIEKEGRVTTLTFTDVNGTKKAEVIDGYTPQKDVDFRDGIDGISPTATIEKEGRVATITITDKNGTTTAEIVDGYTPVKNVDYFDGVDGISPTATVTKSGKTSTITITDKNGTTTAQVQDGADGNDYVITEADKREIADMTKELVPPYDDSQIRDELANKADKADIPDPYDDTEIREDVSSVRESLSDLNDSVESLETNKLNKAELGTTPFVVYDEGLDDFANASGGYYGYNGTTKKLAETRTSSSTYRSIMLECQEGDSFTVKGLGGSSPRLYCFYDSERNGLLVAPNAAEGDGSTILVAPPNTVGVQFCCSYTEANHELTWKMKKGELTVSELESLKADKSELDNKVGFTDWASSSKVGVIGCLNGLQASSSNGFAYCETFDTNTYVNKPPQTFVSKGTLENVLADKGYITEEAIPSLEGYATESYVNTAIEGLELVKVVAELPSVGEANKTYLLVKADGSDTDIYDEYIWVGDKYELIGTKKVEVDLTDYVKNTDWANSVTGGVVKISTSYGMLLTTSKIIRGSILAYDDYESKDLSDYYFISKGTLNNILAGRGYITADDISVDDVQINENSIVSNGIANIPIAVRGTGAAIPNVGLVGVGAYSGLNLDSNGALQVRPASNTNISNRAGAVSNLNSGVIEPRNLDYAVKAALTDGKGGDYTDAEKAGARTRIGAGSEEDLEEARGNIGLISERANLPEITILPSIYLQSANGTIAKSTYGDIGATSLYFECEPNSTYIIEKTSTLVFRIGTTTNIPDAGVPISGYVNAGESGRLAYTTNATAKYIIINYFINDTQATPNSDDVLASIRLGITAKDDISRGAIAVLNNKLAEKIGPTDYATTIKAGVIFPNGAKGFYISNGYPHSKALTITEYENTDAVSFISKGTLEAVLNSKGYITSSDIPTDDHINDLIDAKLGVIENGSY